MKKFIIAFGILASIGVFLLGAHIGNIYYNYRIENGDYLGVIDTENSDKYKNYEEIPGYTYDILPMNEVLALRISEQAYEKIFGEITTQWDFRFYQEEGNEDYYFISRAPIPVKGVLNDLETLIVINRITGAIIGAWVFG